MSLDQLIADHLADWECGWSMGSFGAIAEFHQDLDEPAPIDDPLNLVRATERGGIRFDGEQVKRVKPVAYETLSPKPHRWSQAIALCMTEENGRRESRSVLTELGPDMDAIRAVDRGAILFDMGLNLSHCDFCVRTRDEALLQTLRRTAGRKVLDHGNPAMAAILAAHPHRVAITKLGRTEVYQKIGGPDTGGVSPPGPHTHVLPKLLKTRRSHSANTPIPDGFVPLAYMHPGNPVIGPMGEDRQFDPALHAAFQDLLERYGHDEVVHQKQRLLTAMEGNGEPDNFCLPESRLGRAAVRLAFRQHEHSVRAIGDARGLERISAWRSVLEPNHVTGDEDDDAPGH